MILFDFEEEVAFTLSLIKLELQKRLQTQGHGKKGRSKLIDSMEQRLITNAQLIIGQLWLEEYYIFVDKGVKPANIPYTPGQRRAKVSKYIQGLFGFFQRKGLNPREALGAAFATANKHKQEGMSTRNSRRFSRDGTRQGFFTETIESFEDTLFQRLQQRVGDKIEASFFTMLQDVQLKLN